MELSLSHCSSLPISAVNPHCKTSSCLPKAIPSKLNAKHFDLSSKCSRHVASVGVYSHSSCSKHVPATKVKRNPIWACSQVGAAGSDSDPMLNKISSFSDACWRFLRPHTMRGTVIGSAALLGRTLIENLNLINSTLVLKYVSGLTALICGNGYVVGLNQIYDIDKKHYRGSIASSGIFSTLSMQSSLLCSTLMSAIASSGSLECSSCCMHACKHAHVDINVQNK